MKMFARAASAAFMALWASSAVCSVNSNPLAETTSRICLLSENAPEFVALEERVVAKYMADYKRGALTLDLLSAKLLSYIHRHPGIENAFKQVYDAKRVEGLAVDQPEIKAELIIRLLASVDVLEHQSRLCPTRDARLQL